MIAYCNNSPVSFHDPNGHNAYLCNGRDYRLNRMFDSFGGCGGAFVSGSIASAGMRILSVVTLTVAVITEAIDSIELIRSSRYSRPKAEEVVVATTTVSTSQESAIYYGYDYYGGDMRLVTGPMTFFEADAWATATALNHTYTNRESWGLYTQNLNDAASMAAFLGCPDAIFPDFIKLLPDSPKSPRHYWHFHTLERTIHGISAPTFHIWYGVPGG